MRLFQFSGFFQMLAISVMNLYPLYWLSLGYTPRTIGILNGVGMIAAVIGPILFAWIASRKAPARIIAICFFASALATPLMLVWTHAIPQTALFGLGQFLKVGYLTLVPVGVLHLLGDRAGRDYGRYRRMGSAGFLLAGFAGWIVELTHPSISIWIVTGATLLAALPFIRHIQIPTLRLPTDSWKDLFQNRGLRYFLIGSTILSSWNAGAWIFLPLRMKEMGASPMLISWTMAECGLIAILTLTAVGRLADKMQKPSWLYLFVPVAAALRFILMAIPQENPSWFLLIQWTHVVVWVLGEVVQIQYIRQHVQKSLFPRAQAAMQIATYAGMGGASALMGMVVPYLGLQYTLASSAVLPLLALPFLWISHRATLLRPA